jgi:hypothetical protein
MDQIAAEETRLRAAFPAKNPDVQAYAAELQNELLATGQIQIPRRTARVHSNMFSRMLYILGLRSGLTVQQMRERFPVKVIGENFDGQKLSQQQGSEQPLSSEPQRPQRLRRFTTFQEITSSMLQSLGGPGCSVHRCYAPTMQFTQDFGEYFTYRNQRVQPDPSRNPVFNSDAYTVRFPQPEYGKMKQAAAKKIIKPLLPFQKLFNDHTPSDVWRLLVERGGVASAIDKLSHLGSGQRPRSLQVKGHHRRAGRCVSPACTTGGQTPTR